MAKANDAKQFEKACKAAMVDKLHEVHSSDPNLKAAIKPSDITGKIDEYWPTFLKLYTMTGGLLIPAAAKPAADLFVGLLGQVKALADQLAGTVPTSDVQPA